MHWYGTKSLAASADHQQLVVSSSSASAATTTTTNMKMTVLDGCSLLSLTKWSDEGGHYVRDFLAKHPQLPQVARVLKGQYLTVGASSSFSQVVLLCSKGKRLKVAAQCVKFKEDGRKVVPVGPKLAIPDNYEGWFEILSEEGRAVRCIESVAELARRFPDSCLVREALKAYVARGDDLETITDKVRTIAAGETLVLVSEVLGTSATDKSTGSANSKANPGRFLRCFDARGENVYLGFEQRGKFSILAKEDNISGVHSIKNLMTTKRFPMMVRLVSGKMPVQTSSPSSANFVPELRLFAAFEEECVMVMSMQKEQPVVAVPLTASLKLQAAKNMDALCKTTEFARLNDTCKGLVHDVEDKIQVIGSGGTAAAVQQAAAPVKKLPYFRRAFSDPQGYIRSTPAPPVVPPTSGEEDVHRLLVIKDNMKDDTRYDEIDQIYDYVRGFAPPPKVTSSNDDNGSEDGLNKGEGDNGPSVTTEGDSADPSRSKPDPPPIETIPVRRAAYPDLLLPVSAINVSGSGVGVQPILIPPVSLVKRAAENIYERIPRKMLEARKSSNSSSSAAARYFIHARSTAKNKVYVKGNSVNSSNLNHNNNLNNFNNNNCNNNQNNNQNNRQSSGQRSRLFRQNKNSFPLMVSSKPGKDQQVPPRTVRSATKSSTASPIFNIRYKSLTNLHAVQPDFNTLESSNSGGGNSASFIFEDNNAADVDVVVQATSKNQAAKLKKKKVSRATAMAMVAATKLPRPKSLSNLLVNKAGDQQLAMDMVTVVHNRVNILNSASYCSNLVESPSSTTKSPVSKASNADDPADSGTNRIGTLYL